MKPKFLFAQVKNSTINEVKSKFGVKYVILTLYTIFLNEQCVSFLLTQGCHLNKLFLVKFKNYY